MDPKAQEKRGFLSKIPRKLKWLIVALVFNNVAIGYLLVYLTAFFPELNISAGIVGLLLGLEGAMVLLSIPLGILSDRKGRKKLLLTGTSLVPLPIIMIALTVNVTLLVVAAIILGIAESAALSTWNAIIADQTSLENRDASFSLSFILGNGGVAFGFLLPTFIPAIQSLTGLNSITVHQDLLVLVGLVSAITPVWLFRILRGYKETPNPSKLIRGKNFPTLLKFSGINSLIGLGAGFIIRAALMNMSVPLQDSYLMGIMSQEERGLASSINTVVWRIPNSITTVIGGLILATGRFDIPFYLAAVFYVISISLFYTQFKNIRPQS